MAKSKSVNYTRMKAHYGGIPGTIQQNALEGVLIGEDIQNPVFRENFPAGFLPCDGRVYNVADYYNLGNLLGIGTECRFRKDDVILRDPDPDEGDLGQFQVPDLGSKVIIGGRGTGTYTHTFLEGSTTTRVGVEVDANSNIGNQARVDYTGHMTIDGQSGLDFNGNVKYVIDRKTTPASIDIESFQAHSHTVNNLEILNYAAKHLSSGDGVGNKGASGANASAGNILEETTQNDITGDQFHEHTITSPTTYTDDFAYSFPNTNVDLGEMYSYIDVDVSNMKVLNQVVTPFIMVHYIIKF